MARSTERVYAHRCRADADVSCARSERRTSRMCSRRVGRVARVALRTIPASVVASPDSHEASIHADYLVTVSDLRPGIVRLRMCPLAAGDGHLSSNGETERLAGGGHGCVSSDGKSEHWVGVPEVEVRDNEYVLESWLRCDDQCQPVPSHA